MSDIVIYTKNYCPYCTKAKDLLKKKNADFIEIDVTSDQNKFEEMVTKANGKRTVPQIFIKGNHIGGCDDLHALENKNQLDGMI